MVILPRFDLARDRLDLADRGLDLATVQARVGDRGWAVETDLDGTSGTPEEDRLILKGLAPGRLAARHFRF